MFYYAMIILLQFYGFFFFLKTALGALIMEGDEGRIYIFQINI